MKLFHGLPAMALGPLRRCSLHHFSYSLMPVMSKHPLCTTGGQPARQQRTLFSKKGCLYTGIEFVTQRRQIAIEVARSSLEMPKIELPQEPTPKLRKRIPKLKGKGNVETKQGTATSMSELAWSKVSLWVVFSDLHFSRRTRDTCLQVLHAIHAEASARNAGIIFLGDFWHARGALPVELLNSVITQVAKWTCPAVFIPGNHDQVNMGGQMHALMVLGAVNPLIKVFDEPTKFLDALWLPFRRDHSLIKDALRQHPNVKAIFAHLDVIGAYLNEASQAKEGIDPGVFPQQIPVFTGHYHKPHVVKNTRIEYIGSPYQVSASELGQSKRFVLLNSLWEKVGEIPIDLGGRHFVVSDMEKLSLENVHGFRPGDHLRVHISTVALEDSFKADVERLQTSGVQIDLVFPILASKPRIEEAENLDAFGLFNLYGERVEMSAGARKKGLEMLRSMDLPAKLIQRTQVKMVLGHVEIQGFGPYLEPVSYPLAERGIRVVCGRNMDMAGADSNGAGKSTLVMAPLWALSGSTDPRPDSMRGLASSDVIHQKAKSASVRVEGTLNERQFTVERTVGRKSSLRFYIDGEDWTGQDMKLTQAKIDELIDTSMLQRIAFHGQYGIGGLLEASDKDFKDELSRVVSMDIWIAAKKKCLQDLRSKQTEVDSLEGALAQLQQQIVLIARKVEESANRIDEWENAQDLQRVQVSQERDSLLQEFVAVLAKCSSEFQRLQQLVVELDLLVHDSEEVLVAEMEAWHAFGNGNVSAELEKKKRESLMTKAAELAVEVRNAEGIAMRRRKMVFDYKTNISGVAICDKCLQSIDSDHKLQTVAQLEEEFTVAEVIHKGAVNEEKMIRRDLLIATETIAELKRREEEVLRESKQKSADLRGNVDRIRALVRSTYSVLNPAAQFLELERSHQFLRETSTNLQSVGQIQDTIGDGLVVREDLLNGNKDREIIQRCKQLEDDIKVAKRMESKLDQLHQSLVRLDNATNPFASECSSLKSVLSALQQNLDQKKRLFEDAQVQAGWFKELDTAFGHSGVQSYILEGALTELQERTARYLEVLSGGSLGIILRPTKELKKTKTAVEKIDRIAVVRLSSGATEQRSLRQMSGGERRRLALAIALGFGEFAAQRSGLQCDLLVLDEVLQHLDSEGKARVVAVLKGLPQKTILLVSQTHGDVADAFDLVDVVVKINDNAKIETLEPS